MKHLHQPVMSEQVLHLLNLKPGDTAVDVTAGAGGHLRLLAQAVGEQGRVLALDQDERAHEQDASAGIAREFASCVVLHRARFSQLAQLLASLQFPKLDGLLCDLGVSSMQLDTPQRGFSFQHDGPVDMRMDSSQTLTAHQWLSHCKQQELADCLFHYGGERHSRRIARWICSQRPLPNSTKALAQLVSRAVHGKKSRIHPATRTFQAIRIFINRELDELHKLLQMLPQVLAPAGRAVFIAFHSAEDRLVKHAFAQGARKTDQRDPCWKLLCNKPLRPQEQEVQHNPRARSARLRAIAVLGSKEQSCNPRPTQFV